MSLCDITPCSSSRVDRRFGGTCRLSAYYQLHDGFFIGLFFDLEAGGDRYPPTRWLNLMGYTALYSRRYNSS
jgi:hypothetical protein